MYKISLERLCSVAREAKNIILSRTLADDITKKGLNDYVTQADIAVQDLIRSRLKKICPEYLFMGEEQSEHNIDPEIPTFVLDPIDGTTNFIHDLHFSAVSLALVHHDETVLAAVYNPFSDEMFSAERDKGAFLNGKKIKVSSADELKNAVVAIGTMPYQKNISEAYFQLYQKTFTACTDIRRTGSAALDLCYVAAGRFDCYIENGLKPWDYAAARLIAEEAGGTVSDWSGKKTVTHGYGSAIAASNTKLHAELLSLTEPYANIKK